MEDVHNIEIVPYKEIWNAIKDKYEYETKKQKKKNPIMQVKRETFLKWWKPKLHEIHENTERNFRHLYKRL